MRERIQQAITDATSINDRVLKLLHECAATDEVNEKHVAHIGLLSTELTKVRQELATANATITTLQSKCAHMEGHPDVVATRARAVQEQKEALRKKLAELGGEP